MRRREVGFADPLRLRSLETTLRKNPGRLRARGNFCGVNGNTTVSDLMPAVAGHAGRGSGQGYKGDTYV